MEMGPVHTRLGPVVQICERQNKETLRPLEQLQQFLKFLSTLSLYLHYQLLSIYFYSNSLLYFTLYSI